MKEYILNTIVLKTGDSIEIVEPSTLPMKERVMYKLQLDPFHVPLYTSIFPLMVKLKIQQYPMNLLFLIQLCLKYNLSCYVPFLP